MCRWLAYTGSPLQMERVLFKARHSLIDQSLHARLGATTTNGDGFGLGWYARPAPDGSLEPPFRYRSVHPAWNDRNLREAARHSFLAVRGAHPRRHRHAGAGNQLPSVPPWQLAVRAQRPDPRLSAAAARPDADDRAGVFRLA